MDILSREHDEQKYCINYSFLFYKNWHTALPCRRPYSKLWHPVVIVFKRISLLRGELFPLEIFILPIVLISSNVIPKNQKELKT